MSQRRLSFRICALTAAYALALHAMAASMVLAGQPLPPTSSGSAPCVSAPAGKNTAGGQSQDQNQNHDHDRSACVLHCLAFSGPDAWTPPLAGILEKFAPAEIRVIALVPIETAGRLTPRSPQSPRAPPLA